MLVWTYMRRALKILRVLQPWLRALVLSTSYLYTRFGHLSLSVETFYRLRAQINIRLDQRKIPVTPSNWRSTHTRNV